MGDVLRVTTVTVFGLFLGIAILLSGCSSAGGRAAEVCTDARLAPGTPAYENCVLRYLPPAE